LSLGCVQSRAVLQPVLTSRSMVVCIWV